MSEPSPSDPDGANAVALKTSSASSTYMDAAVFLDDLKTLALRLKQVAWGADGGVLAPAVRAVLSSLELRGTQTVPELGRLRGTSRQNVQVIVNRLASEDFVTFSPNPAHKRSGLVSLTAKGREALHNSPDPQARIAELLAKELSSGDLKLGAHLFHRLSCALEQAQKGRVRPPPSARMGDAHPAQPDAMPIRTGPAEDENELPVNLL